MKNSAPTQAISEQWCLVTVRQWKRDTFVRHLQNELAQKQLQEIILEIIEPEESVYDNMLILRINSYLETRNILQSIEYFQAVQRLKPDEVSRMLIS